MSIEVESSQILSKIYYLMDIMSRTPAGTEKEPESLSPWFSFFVLQQCRLSIIMTFSLLTGKMNVYIIYIYP